MADNQAVSSAATFTVATRSVTYSGDASTQMQVVGIAIFSGSDDAKTVVDLPGDATNGLDVDVTRVKPDGTNTMPSMDAAARRAYVQITDGTNSADVQTAGSDAQSNTSNRLQVASRLSVFNGTTWDRAKGDTNHLYVGGNVAHDVTDAGNPVKVGARAVTSLDDATMVAAGDRSDMVADLDGVLISKPYCPDADTIVERVSNTDGASTALTNFGATASARNVVSTIVVYNDSTTNGYVDIRDGTGGTVLLTLPCPAKGGVVFNPNKPLRQPTANTALAFDVSAALTTVYLSFIGYKSKA